ncbi:MAG TPA: hypothetical protein VKY27_05105 [Bacteriovoracaceae bacterium]|nr:hypothetical protein [Bacteriovoracaceae bacterium]
MAAVKKQSRLESNKEARRVLNRHGVDLTYCQYSCSGREIRLTGTLLRYAGGDFKASQIETMIYDFQRLLPGFVIVGELDNWSFSSEHINYHGNSEEAEEEMQDEEVGEST